MTEERRKTLSSFKHMMIITIPIFIELLLHLVVGYSDQLMMSNWQNAVNGITNANVVINMILNFFVIFASAAIILITQYKGAKDEKREKAIYSTAFYFNTILSFVMTLAVVFLSQYYLKALNTPDAALNDAIIYSMISGASIVFQIMATTLSSFLKANNLMKESMITNIIMNVLNILGNFILINVFAKIDMPIVGVALSSSISRIAGFVILLIIYIKKIGIKLSFKEFIKETKALKMLLRVGTPSGGEALSYQASQVVIQLVVNQIVVYNDNNVQMGNIKTYASMLAMVTYLFVSAVSQAMQVVIGEQLGAGLTDDVDKKVKQTRNISIVSNLAFATLFFLLSDYLFTLFKVTDPELLKIAKYVMAVEIALELGRAFNIVYVRALQTSGDVVFPTVSAIIFCWCVAVAGSFVLGGPYALNLGIAGVWMAMAIDELVRAVIFVIRWRNGKWKKYNLALQN